MSDPRTDRDLQGGEPQPPKKTGQPNSDGEDFGGDDRSWMDACADRRMLEGPHGGRGPRSWRRSDELLFEAISEHLTLDLLLDARGVAVVVEAGVVTLEGRVHSASDRRLADILAHEVAGVGQVHNHLEVKPDLAGEGRGLRPRLGPQAASLGHADRAERERLRATPLRPPPFFR